MSVSRDTVYESIRSEITDQKSCQFSVMKLAMTVNAAIIGTTAITSGGAVLGPNSVFAALVATCFAAWLVLEKAQSIQRNVGYLKLVEQFPNHPDIWRWEYSLSMYRVHVGNAMKGKGSERTHRYVTSVCMALLALLICTVSCSVAQSGLLWQHYTAAGAALGFGFWIRSLRKELISGKKSPQAIDSAWRQVLGIP